MSQIQTLKCDLCRGEHLNGNCVPNIESAEVQYENFQRNNPHSNTYKPGWKDHLNFKWSNNNQTLNPSQSTPQESQVPQRKSFVLEETLKGFIFSTQESFLKVSQTQKKMMQSQLTTNKNTKASIKNLVA